ncbi:LuxR C-terminal-related transcriptional regulator [Streptomyces sp. V4-01]|uniref:LuxR C-terminal-related transcriptional regulator n=1 Tax=Actinacidiphila polyblastidii TaxID=3110430 RepID=A0ABU7PJ93_9ACTN|nr:LuxR C-terminal-related transcriptional regulator [Streptomyces sp. V4-01]
MAAGGDMPGPPAAHPGALADAYAHTDALAAAEPRGPGAPAGPGGPAAPVRRRTLVGRDDEVAALRAALRGPHGGRGRTLALVGEPGIGKSALLCALTALAGDAGLPVVSGHADGPEPLRPFKALLDLESGAAPPRAAAAVPACTDGLLVATLDDVHLLEPESIPGLLRLIQATADRPVLLALAYRERQLSLPMADALSRALSADRLDRWRLGPLSLEHARTLLGDRPDLDGLHRAGDGNPRYLGALADHGEAGAEAATAILGECAALDRGALAAVQAAAALGEPFHPDLLAEVAGPDVADAMGALDALTRADLVRPAQPAPRLALRHPVVGTVVYGAIDPGRRLALHRRAEAALARRGAPVAERAPHIARAADPDRPDHVAALVETARDCLHRAPRRAAGYLETAVALIPEDGAFWHEARVLLARARLLTGDAAESRALLDALGADLPRGPLRTLAVADTSRAALRLGHYAEAAAVARSGLAQLPRDDHGAAAVLHVALADAALDQRQYGTAERHADTATALARRCGDRTGEAHALAQVSLARLHRSDEAGARAAADGAAELLDGAGDAAVLANLQSLYQLGLTESLLGCLAEAERHLARGAALSRRSGQGQLLPALLKALGEVQLRSGHLPRALATLDEVASWAEHGGSPATLAITLALRAKALLWRGAHGDPHEVLAAAGRAAEIAGSAPTAWAVVVRCLHAEIVMLTGDPQRGGWLLLEAAGGTGLPLLTASRRPRWCDMLAEVATAGGDAAAAERWALLGEESAARLPSAGRLGFARRARMRALASRGETDEAVRSAERAAESFSGGGKRLEVCRTLLAAASLSLDAGRAERVDGWLGRAAALAEQCGAVRLAEEVVGERRRLSAPGGRGEAPDALAALSARERQIADLASTGMTSREIAGTLFLSQRTIDTHLNHIYRKLGLANRVALTRLVLDARGPAPQSRAAVRRAQGPMTSPSTGPSARAER